METYCRECGKDVVLSTWAAEFMETEGSEDKVYEYIWSLCPGCCADVNIMLKRAEEFSLGKRGAAGSGVDGDF